VGAEVIEFRTDPWSADGARIWADDVPLGRVELAPADGVLRARVSVTDLRCGLIEVGGILGGLRVEARGHGLPAVEVTTSDILVRFVARRSGLTGPLRGPLGGPVSCLDPHRAVERSTGDSPPVAGSGAALVTQLGELLGGVRVDLRPVGGWLRRLATSSSSGNNDSRRVTLRTPDGLDLSCLVPDVADLIVENVARAADTAFTVMRRFPADARNVGGIAFDQSDHGLRHGRYAAEANPSSRQIHINSAYASVSGLVALRETIRANSRSSSSLQVGGPFNVVDGTTAHEMWHLIEASFTARRYRDSIEFRRRLGAYFGVATIEHVSHPPAGVDPAVAAVASARLRQEVSAYATTLPGEATAEMFKAWWCATSPPTGVVKVFADLVGEYGLTG